MFHSYGSTLLRNFLTANFLIRKCSFKSEKTSTHTAATSAAAILGKYLFFALMMLGWSQRQRYGLDIHKIRADPSVRTHVKISRLDQSIMFMARLWSKGAAHPHVWVECCLATYMACISGILWKFLPEKKIFLGRVYFLRIFSTSPFSVETWKQVDKNNMKVQDKENLGQALKINGKVG